MKSFILILLCSFTIYSFSQEDTTIKKLKLAIKKADKIERLVLMDSLSNYIAYNTNFETDSIIRETITYAKKLDSIDIVVRQTSNLINFLNYKKGNFKEAYLLIEETKKLFPSLKNKNILSRFYYEVADIYYFSGDFDASLKYFDSSYVYGERNKDKFKGLSILGKGIVYTDQGDFGNASISLNKAANIFREQKDTIKWLDTKNSIAILYGKNGFIKESKKERDELIKIANKLKYYSNLPAVYYNNAGTSNKLGLQEERIQNFKLALKASETSIDRDFFDPLLKLGLAASYAENDSINLSDKLIKEVELKQDINKNAFLKSFYLEATMRIAFEKKNYKKAIELAEEYLQMKYKSKDYGEIQKTEQFLYKVYNTIDKKNLALHHYEKYTKIKDSISNIQNISVLAYYQTLYETEKRDLTIQAQEDSILLLDAENKLKNQYLLFGGLGLLAIFGFIIIIRSRNYLKKKEQLQVAFTQNIMNAQEEERTRLALELHDGVGQQLMLLTRKTKAIADTSLVNLATDTLSNLRTISHGLHPMVLERFGFTAAIEDLINDVDENSNIFFTVEIIKVDDFINKKQALHLYRMFQEIINNMLKYADAKSAVIIFKKQENLLTFIIEDTGKGFDYQKTITTSKSLGMKSLIERSKIINATLKIDSILDKGTKITIELPF